jgi:predicted transposase/invertase (TIGR01784 family)
MALQEKYINPFTDFGFKKLFGTEMNKSLLISFLNQLLPQHHQIKKLSYLKTEYLGSDELDRRAVFDLYCISQTNQRFIVEMQKAKQKYFKDRSIFYITFPIQEQAKKGDWDFRLEAVYMVAILDFTFYEERKEKFFHKVELKDDENRIFYDKLNFMFLEMPKFRKGESELKTTFDKWLYVLKHLSEFQKRPSKLKEKVFERLFKAAEIAKYSKEEAMQYEESLKQYRDLNNVLATSFEEGMIEGERKGMIKGKIEGKIEVARNLLKENMPIDIVAKLTGLSEKEIEKLKAETE